MKWSCPPHSTLPFTNSQHIPESPQKRPRQRGLSRVTGQGKRVQSQEWAPSELALCPKQSQLSSQMCGAHVPVLSCVPIISCSLPKTLSCLCVQHTHHAEEQTEATQRWHRPGSEGFRVSAGVTAPDLHQPQAWAQSRVSPQEVIEAAESPQRHWERLVLEQRQGVGKQDHGQLPWPRRKGGIAQSSVCCSPAGSWGPWGTSTPSEPRLKML